MHNTSCERRLQIRTVYVIIRNAIRNSEYEEDHGMKTNTFALCLAAAIMCSMVQLLPAAAAEEQAEESELQYSSIPVTEFTVGNLAPSAVTDADFTDWWFSEWDDCRYIFLPATADRTALTITYQAEDTLCLNGTPVQSGETTALLNTADSFEITVGETACGTLKVMQSNLGSIFLSTKSVGLDALDANRFLTETGNALMLDADGKQVYKGEIEKLTAHGNSSWDYSKKKPYNLKLPKKADLFGMGKAKKWVLLSNYLDHSMLRNHLVMEMCKAAGMEHVMDSVFVDLYADGSYCGTYQLSEKVQIQKNRVNIRDLEELTEDLNSKDLKTYPQTVIGADKPNDFRLNSYKYYEIPNEPADITGGYLLQFQQWNRYGDKADSGFVTSRGQAVQIDGPEYASEAQVKYIREFVQELEDAIYSEDGYNEKGKHYTDYCDIDSLITAYLALEISQNADAANTSFYLWKDSNLTGDGKLHFGPAWDFDLTFNNFNRRAENIDGNSGFSGNPQNLFTAYCPIQGFREKALTDLLGEEPPLAGRSWLGELYTHDLHVKRVANAYFERFAEFMNNLTDGDDPLIFQYAERILPSAEMNNARWHTYGGAKYCVFGASSGKDYMDSVEILRKYIQQRKDWLSDLWAPETCIYGDVNDDGVFDSLDLVAFRKWMHAEPDARLARWEAADFCKDGQLDVYDFALMKQALLS